MSTPKTIRHARKAKRMPFEIAANDDTPQTWCDFFAQADEVVTDESYQLDQLADANSQSKQINGSRA
jgi:hypothetical protein